MEKLRQVLLEFQFEHGISVFEAPELTELVKQTLPNLEKPLANMLR